MTSLYIAIVSFSFRF